ncbi:hypothetical protein Bca52824_031937 [Brassica carinata]|uniref:Ribose-phosphate pyrophosphokinase N-terminal domain-containing protein n=1 Tax=Brassica carinata TaxID=52824 RepID=A0A8X7V736_BRACI|nr:hypothetical protein Bca52824_031937 [Brassica carinata]
MDRKVSWVSAQRGSVFSVASVRGLLSTRQGRACRSSRTGDLTSGSPITVASGLLAYSISLGVAFRCYVYSFLVTYFNIRCLVSTGYSMFGFEFLLQSYVLGMGMYSWERSSLESVDYVHKIWNVVEGNCLHQKVADGEVYGQLKESVTGCDVFLVQPACTPTNENLMELLIMVDACRRASTKKVTAVIPYFGYARADRKFTKYSNIV